MGCDSEYNQRQLRLLLQVVHKTMEKPIDVRSLAYAIDTIEALLRVLENPEPEWLGQATQEWGDLEQIYASLLDKDRQEFSEQEVGDIRSALSRLEELVTEVYAMSDSDAPKNST